jgi:hypothetical protein
MTLEEQLYEEFNGARDGFVMNALLKKAAEAGLPRAEAEKALERLCNRLSSEGRRKDEDLATEFLMITQNFCYERYRIWPLE